MPNSAPRSVRYLLVLWLISAWGCSSGDQSPTPDQSPPGAAGGSERGEDKNSSASLPLPEPVLGACRIYGGDPQALVLIDGQPARDAAGTPLSPPCEIRVAQGSRTITLSRVGYQDFSKVVAVSESSEVDFPELKPAGEMSITTVAAPLFELEPGTPRRLGGVGSSGAELDPWLSPDGLTIWFSGDRTEGKAIYRATRPSVWHEFGEPEILLLSRGPSLPASPSVSEDDMTLYYAVPRDGRIWKLTRDDAFGRFAGKEVVLAAETESVRWTSAFATPDNLRLYWTELSSGVVRGYAVVRKSPSEKFSRPIEYSLPGLVPMLSSDGLRQYLFDGTSLRRARRASLSDSFLEPQEIRRLALPEYEVQPHRRQFFVSADEQWMIYSHGAEDSADLWIVRLDRVPGWGVAPVGKPIEPRPMVVASAPEPSPTESSEVEPAVDPRSVPLPFAEYRPAWEELVARREYDRANALTRENLGDPRFEADADMLRQDLKIVKSIEQFWELAEETFRKMEPGRSVTIGSARGVFQKFEDGSVFLAVGDNTVERSLREFPAAALSTIVETALELDQAAERGWIAHFLVFDKDGRPVTALARIKNDPDQQRELERILTAPDLHLARQEIERDNIVVALALLERVSRDFPDSAAFEQAKEIERSLYERTEWQTMGERNWQTGEEGEFRADRRRVENAFLRSPRSYRDFMLQFEWMTFDELGQGGVFFHYPGQGPVYGRAFKIHLANDYRAAPDEFSSGALFGVAAPSENAVKRSGEWNQCRIEVRDGDVEVFMNGKKVLDTLAISDEIPEEGLILFDGITGGIAYRHILLTEAP
jgi:hypothetical protein